MEALEKVKNNIYIPYLVALEFNFQKSSLKKRKIKNIQKYKDEVRSSLGKIKNMISPGELIDESEEEEFTEEMLSLTDKFSEELMGLVDSKIKSVITEEESDIYDRLINLIEGSIGEKYTQEWIDVVEKEGQERYSKKIPPGFDDSSKENEEDAIRYYDNIKYQRKFGDLLIWKEIIDYTKIGNESGRKVIYVTNDGRSKRKSDLLYKVNDLVVGPSIYLMNELCRESDKQLYIVSNLRFIQLVNDLSETEVDKLKTSSETLYRIKFPSDYMEQAIKDIEELNKRDDGFVHRINDEGYLERKQIIDEDVLKQRINDDILKQRINDDILKQIINNDILKQRINDDILKQIIDEDVLKQRINKDAFKQIIDDDIFKQKINKNTFKHYKNILAENKYISDEE
ncbi:PIN-like domain-containing protein [Vagococcus sp. PNs007]|uniref:PIN-like domain-containing protein n=1 Tax=Vagococcus proximus TaxID=2991417 RepID=A0ABT5X178_9ENTE|nr:PIN-like domain-containing protein [Vagococcus proximus]